MNDTSNGQLIDCGDVVTAVGDTLGRIQGTIAELHPLGDPACLMSPDNVAGLADAMRQTAQFFETAAGVLSNRVSNPEPSPLAQWATSGLPLGEFVEQHAES